MDAVGVPKLLPCRWPFFGGPGGLALRCGGGGEEGAAAAGGPSAGGARGAVEEEFGSGEVGVGSVLFFWRVPIFQSFSMVSRYVVFLLLFFRMVFKQNRTDTTMLTGIP